jgi:hypothetical protein
MKVLFSRTVVAAFATAVLLSSGGVAAYAAEPTGMALGTGDDSANPSARTVAALELAGPTPPQTQAAEAQCARAAKSVLDEHGVSTDSFDFGCVAGTVKVETASAAFLRQAPADAAATPPPALLEGSADLNCDPTEPPNRHIANELNFWAQFCVVYGHGTEGSADFWARSIWTTWDLFTGWPSTQNKINTQPVASVPKLQGTVSARRQAGVFPPIVVATSLWSNTGNQTTSGWVVGGFTTGGTYSVALNDLEVTDSQKAFHMYIGDEIASMRFMCDSGEKRCYYPNGQEAPVL